MAGAGGVSLAPQRQREGAGPGPGAGRRQPPTRGWRPLRPSPGPSRAAGSPRRGAGSAAGAARPEWRRGEERQERRGEARQGGRAAAAPWPAWLAKSCPCRGTCPAGAAPGPKRCAGRRGAGLVPGCPAPRHGGSRDSGPAGKSSAAPLRSGPAARAPGQCGKSTDLLTGLRGWGRSLASSCGGCRCSAPKSTQPSPCGEPAAE